jgi:hypothetical protein
MTDFFGKRWDAPIVDNARYVPTPVGQVCYQCDRPIERGDQGFIRPLITEGEAGLRPIHRGCDMATTVGHIFGLCNCTGWNDIYERGRELVRRADAGLLVAVSPGPVARETDE